MQNLFVHSSTKSQNKMLKPRKVHKSTRHHKLEQNDFNNDHKIVQFKIVHCCAVLWEAEAACYWSVPAGSSFKRS